MNKLYPIFVKVDQLRILIVGGGSVAAEKIHFLLKSSPEAQLDVVSPKFNSCVQRLAKNSKIRLIKSEFDKSQLEGKSIVVSATDNSDTNTQVYNLCKKLNILINVADQPRLCDFYMGGVVTKGNLKIAISTNGKSPTMAKRLRQYFENEIPEDIDDLLLTLHEYRKSLKGDFQTKVKTLNELTKQLVHN